MNELTIYIFGASASYGDGSLDGGWVTALRSQLDRRTPYGKVSPHLIHNLSIPGDTTDDLRRRFVFETEARLKEGKRRPIFVFAIGGNDVGRDPLTKTLAVPPERFVENMGFLIGKAKVYGLDVRIQDITPVNEAVTMVVQGESCLKSNADVDDYNARLALICRAHDVTLVGANTAFRAIGTQHVLCDDGIHPNRYGHEELARLHTWF
jgi:lysophospholipase L1-like esterase